MCEQSNSINALADYQQMLNMADTKGERLIIMVTASMDFAMSWDDYGELCEYESRMED